MQTEKNIIDKLISLKNGDEFIYDNKKFLAIIKFYNPYKNDKELRVWQCEDGVYFHWYIDEPLCNVIKETDFENLVVNFEIDKFSF